MKSKIAGLVSRYRESRWLLWRFSMLYFLIHWAYNRCRRV